MESEMGFTVRTGPHKAFFRIISETLCEPSQRLTMEGLLGALECDLGEELPWIVDVKRENSKRPGHSETVGEGKRRKPEGGNS